MTLIGLLSVKPAAVLPSYLNHNTPLCMDTKLVPSLASLETNLHI